MFSVPVVVSLGFRPHLRTRSEFGLPLMCSPMGWGRCCLSWVFESFSAAAMGHPDKLKEEETWKNVWGKYTTLFKVELHYWHSWFHEEPLTFMKQFHFFIVENGSLKGSLGNPKLFFYCFATKTPFGTFTVIMWTKCTAKVHLGIYHVVSKSKTMPKKETLYLRCVFRLLFTWPWPVQPGVGHFKTFSCMAKTKNNQSDHKKEKSQPMKGLHNPKKRILPASVLN